MTQSLREQRAKAWHDMCNWLDKMCEHEVLYGLDLGEGEYAVYVEIKDGKIDMVKVELRPRTDNGADE
jgi:hypothetical protein